ncbi:MAG: DUF368 domain-containing protein [Flavobacteriales bacterium]|nr:DUF368 domain-containing protein [Flavobacteriales bacterium]
MSRTAKDYSLIFLKGIGMGAADVVPGVSGGTIAFISGIYEELLGSINSVNLKNAKLIITKGEGIKSFWKAINGNFLASLMLGIGISIASLAKAITWMLEHHPVMIWSFFFGLVLASIFYVGKEITKWNLPVIVMFILGTAIAYYITVLGKSDASTSLPYLFLCGSIAICAMILPGISGSFILVLLGAYSVVLGAIHTMDLKIIAVFATGCVVGLLLFSRLLSYLLKNFHNVTVALLAGFMLGSLNKVWPWKETISFYENSKGEKIPFQEANILPTDNSWQIAILAFIVGFILIFAIEWIAGRKKTSEA